jgi:hypothetical protein
LPLVVELSQLVELVVHNLVAAEGKIAVVGEHTHCIVVELVVAAGLQQGQQNMDLLANTRRRCRWSWDSVGLLESRKPK